VKTARRSRRATAALVLQAVLLAACGSSSSPVDTDPGGILPPAEDLPESGLQGQTPLADQLSGKSAAGYRKGLRLVGQNTILNRGGNFSLAWIDDCAYVTTSSFVQTVGLSTNPSGLPIGSPLNGMAVIDASDPARPELVSILKSPAVVAPHESLRASESRKIIVATLSTGDKLDVYDASDCRHPVLKSTTTIPDYGGHAVCLSDDGRTAYLTNWVTGRIGSVIVDLGDLDHPRVLGTTGINNHDCDFNEDGTRVYAAQLPATFNDPNGPNGLVIWDVSDFRKGVANPLQREVGSLLWTSNDEHETGPTHTARMFKVGGRRYVYSNDEQPLILMCPWAHGRIIDITDERNPQKVSDLILDVQKPENCARTLLDLANYSAHYVGFDDAEDAKLLFETAYAAGLRVWDIRDTANPKEIAYWKPAPVTNTKLLSTAGPVALANGSFWDSVPTYVRYRPEKRQIWIAGYTSGFQILEFTQSAISPDRDTTTN
jgi:hypothetical protein